MSRWSATWVGLAIVLTAGCGGTAALDSVDAGRTRVYEPGVPNFDMESLVRIEQDGPVVDVFCSIPLSSLVFTRVGDRYVSEYELVAQLEDRETDELVTEVSTGDTLYVSDFDSTISFHPLIRRLTLVPPNGEYIVDVMLTDLESGEMTRRRQAVHVPGLGTGEPFVSRILLEGVGEDGSFEPVVSLHMPALLDSLRASIQLYNVGENADLSVTMRLVRFESDTTVASPPYWLVPARGSLEYRGIDRDEADTVQVSRRPLRSATGDAVIEFSLPRLRRGIYRLSVSGNDSTEESMLERERLLSVKNSTFPRMTTLDDLVESLAYIAFENEIEAIQEAETQIEKKRRFDAFWGSLVPNRNLAASLIKLYYGRIEEANLFFTGFKEGWKTDRGMIYTILGPPLYVDQRVDSETWYYSFGDRDPVNTFVFERVRPYDDEPFETYILQRRPYYQQEWTRAVDRWRSGDVL